jgi:hypothetical protein
MLGHLLNEYKVRILLNPKLDKEEELCNICMRRDGLIGIVRYAGRITGTETQCVERYDGDYTWTEDATFGVCYDQWKCQRCGYVQHSDYA